jgi:phosphate transport system substrate-binding protein
MKCISYTLLFTLLFLYSCNSEKHSIPTKEVVVGGSDTEYEIVDLLIHSFQENNSQQFNLTAGGSNAGMEQLLNGEIQMANSSRKITKEETLMAKENNISLKEIIFAYDALAIISHPSLGIDSLSTLQLAQIFKGEIKNWKEVGGKDLAINIYGRDINSGSRKYIENRFVRDEGFSSNYFECNGSKDIINKVKNDVGGIGYVGVGYIMKSYGMPANDVWAISIYTEGGNAFSPYEYVAIMNREYDLMRPLYQYINENNSKELSDFINFELSEKGQEIIKQYGFYPINDETKAINSQNGF